MRSLISSLSMFVAVASALPGQSIDCEKTVWPARIAVGMRRGPQFVPLVVEATPTGWVSLTPLSTRPDAGLGAPPMHMMAEARDLKRWIGRVRELLDSTRKIDA